MPCCLNGIAHTWPANPILSSQNIHRTHTAQQILCQKRNSTGKITYIKKNMGYITFQLKLYKNSTNSGSLNVFPRKTWNYFSSNNQTTHYAHTHRFDQRVIKHSVFHKFRASKFSGEGKFKRHTEHLRRTQSCWHASHSLFPHGHSQL